jgi:hypothetical protein
MNFHDPWHVLIAIGTFLLTVLVIGLVVLAFRVAPSRPSSLFDRLVVLLLSLVGTGFTWSLCYLGLVSGVMETTGGRGMPMSVTYLASNPTSYWASMGVTYFMGVFFLSIGIVMLLAPKAPPQADLAPYIKNRRMKPSDYLMAAAIVGVVVAGFVWGR